MKGSVSVLLVDDDEDTYVLVQSILADQHLTDYRVDWVPDPDRAVALLKQNRHDACLLDFQLGAKTGLDVLKESREGHSRVPVILLTSHDASDLDWAALKAGAVDFLSKESLGTAVLDRTLRYSVENARTLRRLEVEAGLLAAVIDNIGDGLMICDAEGHILQVNRAFTRITGFVTGDLVGNVPDLLDPTNLRILESKGEWRDDRIEHRKDGTTFMERVVLRVVKGPDGSPTHYVSLHSDVTREHQREQHLHSLAHHDALTDLPNRILLKDRMSQALFQASRYNSKLAVLYIDLDNFKPVNDRFGHEQGDQVLKETSARILSCIRKEDTAARLGGDEFAVLLASADGRDGVATVARKIIAAVRQPLTKVGGGVLDVVLGASVGISLYPEDGPSPSDLIDRADEAMYWVKRRSKNAFAFFADGEQPEDNR